MPDFIKAIGAARFGVMAGVAAALVGFFLYTAGVLTTPPKSILFSGLDPKDASAITAKLDSMNVPYDAKDNGATILVPADQVTKLRMDMAQADLPAAGVGYEIFDKSDAFGTTAFVQNINRLRALEGELARSIQTIDGIESVRVHLVVPERQIFARDSQTPSGSVVVKTRGTLNRGQVQAVQHLVAAAVAGLTPERVAIVDDHGNLLAGGQEKTGDDAVADTEEQHTTDFEDRMRKRVESMVASIVGDGHVRAQVTANIDYNHTQTTEEKFDPDSKVVRSTQTVEQNSSDNSGSAPNAVSVSNALPGQPQAAQGPADSNRSSSGRTEEMTNYEISKTVQTSTVDQGQVKRLSVAVVVDGTGAAGAYKPRSAADMKQIDALVKSAIGYDATRGDVVQVVNMPFARVEATTEGTPAPTPFLGLDAGYWFKIIQALIFAVAAVLIFFFVGRPLIKRMFAPLQLPAYGGGQLAQGSPAAAQLAAPQSASGDPAQIAAGQAPQMIPPPRESMIDISRIEGQVRESSVKKVGEVVNSHPEEALAILRSWLHQPV